MISVAFPSGEKDIPADVLIENMSPKQKKDMYQILRKEMEEERGKVWHMLHFFLV